MRKLSFFFFTIMMAGISGATSAMAANLVTNGGFETGNLTGWSLTGVTSGPAYNGIDYGVDAADAYSGNYGAFFGPPGGIMTLSQTLSTTPGTNYTISFWLAQDTDVTPGYTNSLAVLLGSTTAYSATNIAAQDYTFYTVSGVASTASDLLRFSFRNDAGYFSLDDVSVIASTSSTPEPATLFLIAPVLGGFLFLRRRKAPIQQ